MKKLFLVVSVLVVTTTFYACFKNPVTGRSSLNIAPESEMRQMATQQYATVISSGNVSKGTKDAEMVQRVGQKISKAVGEYLSSIGKADIIADYKWEFNLINDNQVNAWCMPGGKVAFYTGIMPLCQNEAGVATVMGHEIAHAISRHGNERFSQGLMQQFGGVALSVALAEKPQETQALYLGAYGALSQVGVMLPFSRSHESEADHMGLIFMAMAGYNPNEAINFWQRMAAQGGAKPPEFLSTHPSDERRINDIRGKIPEAMKHYKPN
ncbi:MAG: M48 family metallopeptidase [Chitinophagales bacterium]|nr:M48 family metallopeptidase [Chitinophagaceae bacterium]MCB9065948.1 M48 family metallopeptidase [Chitinophagales bacterium]